MTKTMNHRYADASNKAESYERASAFLSSWIQDSLVVPPIKAAKLQRHLPLSIPLSDPHPRSGTLRRRSTISDDDNINSLVNYLQISIKLHEHEHQNFSSNHGSGSRVCRNVSPRCVGAVLHKELPSRRGRGVISCSSLKNGDEKTSPLPSNRPSQTKSSRKKSRLHTVAMEYNTSNSAADKPSSSEASLSLDRLTELDGPNFDLGDTFRSTKYQIIEPNPTKALNLINQLRIHDFAWVLRSSHEWTFAIVADFPNEGDEASIQFVIDKLGNTKTLKMKHWAMCIRLVDSKSTSH